MPKSKRKSCFCDLRLRPLQDADHNRTLLEFSANTLGYQCVAVECEYSLVKKSQVPRSCDLSEIISGYPGCVQGSAKVLQRLTVTVDDPSLLHVLSSPAVGGYDIMAVRPGSERTFQQACATMPVDIISMDVTCQLPYTLRRQQIGQALERGVVFEICYCPALLDPTARRYTFSNALELVRLCKGKNVIVSSGAQRPMELRAPYDVANLCHLFGVKGGGVCKDMITTNCRLALLHAEMRLGSAKGIVTCCQVKELEDKDMWQIGDPLSNGGASRLVQQEVAMATTSRGDRKRTLSVDNTGNNGNKKKR